MFHFFRSALFRLAPILIGCLLQAATAICAEYYVSPDGDDEDGAGSISEPWGTIDYAAAQLSPGDKLYARGGLYNEIVSVEVSGSSADGWITIAAYPGETPAIDGTGLAVQWETGLFYLEDVSYVKIVGFELRNLSTGNANYTPAGIWVMGSSHHIELADNLVHHIETDHDEGNAHGIAVYGTTGTESIHDISIARNEIRNCKLGSSESMVLNGNVEDFVVENNIVHDNDNIGIDFIGREGVCPNPASDMARDGLCAGNTVYGIDSANNPAYGGDLGADGIYVDGAVRIVIERNIVYDCNIGIELASEHAGFFTEDIVVRNNFVYSNHIGGMFAGGYDTARGGTRNCAIVHNTLYQNDSEKDGNGELTLQYDVNGLTIENNIFVANEQNLFISNPYEENVGSIVDFNVHYGPGGPDNGEWQWQDQAYYEFSAWKSETGNDANSVFADPLLILPASGDLHIASDSPARDASCDLDDAVRGSLDIDGDDRSGDGSADIGADETVFAKTIFVSGTDTTCGQNEPCRSTLEAGLALCETGRPNIVKVEQGTYPEDVAIESSCEIFLRCGYGPDFATNPGTSSARTVSVRQASVTVENLILEPVQNQASR